MNHQLNHIPNSGLRGAKRLVLLQLAVSLGVSVVIGIFSNLSNGLSALSAGLIVVLVNTYYVYQFFAKTGAQAAKEILRRICWAEALKILFSILLFILAFRFLHVKMLPFLMTYIIVQSMFWLSPLVIK